uniref:Apple domain-containing protein n=1 Tax=Gasterosteus aculeatus TaxID=69293 RepID=G3N792_GASAC
APTAPLSLCSVTSLPAGPLCPAPAVTHGALVCRPAANGEQGCDLICHRGYQNALPVSNFLCRTESRQWDGGDGPVGGACRVPQPLQSVSSSQLWTLSSSCSQISSLRSLLSSMMTSRGLCSAQYFIYLSPLSVSLCDDSSVSLLCVGDDTLKVTLTWTAQLSDLPTSDLPDLHDIGEHLVVGIQGLLGNIRSMLSSQPRLVSVTTPSFGCSHGYRLAGDGEVCVVCPAGSYSGEGACLLCPEGTYQDEEGRDLCHKCPTGSSPPGASSVNQCLTECQRRGLRCSERGDFLPAQPDFLSGRWRCFDGKGAELEWTNRDEPWTDDECSVIVKPFVPGSDLIVRAEDTEVLQTTTSDLTSCVQACAVEPSCHYVALINRRSVCELYSTHTMNTHCNASQQTIGFLGNSRAELFSSLSCSLRVRGGASDLLVVRKKGIVTTATRREEFERMTMTKAVSGVFRIQVFPSGRTSLSDAHRFCQDGCSRDACCDGFVLNRNSLSGGSLLCGWLRAPSVLMCGDKDWDMIGQGTANRVCGAGLAYNEKQSSFVFDFGGEKFNITDTKNQKDYQASIVSFQAVYLKPGSWTRGHGDTSPAAPLLHLCCLTAELSPPPDEEDVHVDPLRALPSLSFWLNRKNYDSQKALLWCLAGCDGEPRCSVADLGDADSPWLFACSMHADGSQCGAYHEPVRRPCRPLPGRPPPRDRSSPVLTQQREYGHTPSPVIFFLLFRFMECERRCDEDPCCRGIGFVQDTESSGNHGNQSLISLGVQTCSEVAMTTARTQDCSPSVVKHRDPFGWYQKPVNQWSSSPALCPQFSLPTTNVSLDQWRLLSDSSFLVDPSMRTYDVIHVSRDIATNREKTRDWCLHACQEAESCVAVSLSEEASATRCVLYPDTTACGLNSAPSSSRPASSCRLVIREPAPRVYLRTGQTNQERLSTVTSFSVPGHGTLRGVVVETSLGSDRKRVVQFLGVPYARPPTGSLRFEAARPSDWSGDWDATRPRPSCIQPGDEDSPSSSEDCLYLNIFTPASLRGRVPVLVFFFNPSANQSPGLLDGSALAAVGDVVVVTASYRTAALGFLSTVSSGLRGNYGLSDQEAVLRWVNAHISLVGGDNRTVTVGSERGGADVTSLHLLSSPSPPPFQRMMLMGGSVFSPSLVQTSSASRRRAVHLAKELGCVTSDLPDGDDDKMAACLRAAPVSALNAAQTKLLAVSGPFQSWAPARPSSSRPSLHGVDLLLGSSQHDGLIGRARKIKDFEALRGRADGKTAFYEALSRSLGGVTGSDPLKEVAAWYSLDHGASPAGYNRFSRALDNATRDLFIICPSLQMASHWANSKANVFLYHQPATSSHNRADASVPLDVQLVFGTPHHPMSSQRFTSSDRRLSLAMMTYVSSFIKSGNPN